MLNGVSKGDDTLVAVAGEVDVLSAPGLVAEVEAVLAAGVTTVVLDLANVTFMASEGLAALLRIERLTTAAAASLVLRNPSPPVSDLLDMTHLSDRFRVG